jgi:hypothetical protein
MGNTLRRIFQPQTERIKTQQAVREAYSDRNAEEINSHAKRKIMGGLGYLAVGLVCAVSAWTNVDGVDIHNFPTGSVLTLSEAVIGLGVLSKALEAADISEELFKLVTERDNPEPGYN